MPGNTIFIPYKIIIVAFVFFLTIIYLGIDIKQVEGHSMEPTIMPGRFVLINKFEYGIIIPIMNKYLIRWRRPGVGDLVMVSHPLENKVIIKRCAAASGDIVFMADTYLIVNSKIIPGGDAYKAVNSGVVKVPDDKSLIIGDNYLDSIDSRAFGFIANTNIWGRVILL